MASPWERRYVNKNTLKWATDGLMKLLNNPVPKILKPLEVAKNATIYTDASLRGMGYLAVNMGVKLTTSKFRVFLVKIVKIVKIGKSRQV